MALQSVTDILIRTSTVAGEKPQPSTIQLGELAFNTADQVGFLGTGGGGFLEFPLTGAVAGAANVTSGVLPPVGGAVGDLWVDTTDPAAPTLHINSTGGWLVVASVDGTTVVHDPVTGDITVGTVDMGTFP